MVKSRKQREEEDMKMVQEVMDGLVEEGMAIKDGDKYCLTDLGLCEAEEIARQGPIERLKYTIKTTRMYMEQDKKKQEKRKE